MSPAWGTMTKTIPVPSKQHGAYQVPDPGDDLQLDLVADAGVEILTSEVQCQDGEDYLLWQRTLATPAKHTYNLGMVLSSREWVWIKGTYRKAGAGGGTAGQPPEFNAMVPGVDLDVEGVDEADEESTGVLVCVSNAMKTITLYKVQPQERYPSAAVKLEGGGGRVKVWTNANKTGWVPLPQTFAANGLPKTLWIEGISPSASVRDTELKASYTCPNGDVTEDKIKLTVIKVELKVTHPQNPGPTGSAAKYNNTPNTGSADNLFATWLNEQFRVNVNIEPAALANNLPAGFIKWTTAGFTIPDNTAEYTFSWSSVGVKEITVEFPSCSLTKKVRVDVPDVGILSQTAAAALVGAPSVFVLAYAQEAINYSNTNFPVGPKRDAFRHAYWMSLSVSQLGVAQGEALLISMGHEHDNRDDDHQQAFNSTMDLHNNLVGSGIGHTTLLGTPDRTPIQNDITQQYTNGGLWIWAGGGAQENSEGVLVKSNGSKIYSD